jgi:hypothetical protein
LTKAKYRAEAARNARFARPWLVVSAAARVMESPVVVTRVDTIIQQHGTIWGQMGLKFAQHPFPTYVSALKQ